jgi:hypothetical protein
MADFFKRLPEGKGPTVNKKQTQDFIKTLLFEKSLADITDLMETDYAGMPGAALAVTQTMSEAVKTGDFSRLRPLLDFAFEKNARGRK